MNCIKEKLPITNLELTKPFIFLDYANAPKGPGFGYHPHSGIAKLMYPLTFENENSVPLKGIFPS